ncbi:MAG TPA: hypothetical protein VFY88_14950 [Intrasporangium sp.]|nr:hypothetical protein [Intrasporangium sp.]
MAQHGPAQQPHGHRALILLDGVPDWDEVIGQGPVDETLNGLRARVEGAR